MISVIIATHKRANLLDIELQHIYSQKNAKFEVLIINDIEDDKSTKSVVYKYPNITYIENVNIQGPSNKYKEGFRLAKGEYVYMPNDDDYLTDDFFFEKCVKLLETKDTISFVSGNVSILHEHDNQDKAYIEDFHLSHNGRISNVDYLQNFQMSYDKPLSTVSTIFRKSAFDNIGINNIIEFSDSSQYLMALLSGDAYIIKDRVAIYRVRDDKSSLTSNLPKSFIINVLRQKYDIFKRLRGKLKYPKSFWKNQYVITYEFYESQTSIVSHKWYVLLWGLGHNGFSINLIKYIVKKIAKL